MQQYYYNPFGNSSDVDEIKNAAFLKMQQQKKEKHEIRMISLGMGCAIIAYLVIQTIMASLLPIFGLRDVYQNNAVFQYAFNILGVSFASVAVPFGIMALVNKKNYTGSVIPNSPIKASRLFLWTAFGMSCCIVSNIAISFFVIFVKNLTGIELKQGDMLEPSSAFDCVMIVIGLAIIPAICEEFAMRCCSLQLLKKYGKGFGVFAVSVVFGLLHGNVVQFIFAFIMGLVLGLATIKTNSIAPAVLIHAFNNGVSALQYILKYASGNKVADNAVTAIYIFWFVAGVLSGAYLLFKKEFKADKSVENKSVLTLGQRIGAFLFPCQIVPFIILIVLTAMSIKK